MQVIDTDPDFLRQAAAVTRHAYEQSITHVEAEIKGVIPELMETLTPEGPYGYTILPEVRADGSVGLPIITTREGIREAYQLIRGMSQLLSVTPLTEIRGSWYTFQDNLSRGRLKENGYEGPPHQTLALFPSGAGTGITGELVWIRVPRSRLGGEAAPADGEVSGDTLSVALEREKVSQTPLRVPRCSPSIRCRRSPLDIARETGIRCARLRQRDGHADHAGGQPTPIVRTIEPSSRSTKSGPSMCCLWLRRTGTSSLKFASRSVLATTRSSPSTRPSSTCRRTTAGSSPASGTERTRLPQR